MKLRAFILALALLLALTRPCLADQAVIFDQAYADDASASLTFSQARNLTLTPFKGTLRLGLRPSATWIRFKLRKPGTASALFLTIKPQFMDEIALYDPGNPDAPPQLSGDTHTAGSPDFASLENMFTLRFNAQEKEYWLRVRPSSAMALEMQVATSRNLISQSRKTELVYGIHIGLTLWLIIWSLAMLTTNPGDRIIAAFTMEQSISLLHVLSSLGYLRYAFADWSHAHLFHHVTRASAIAGLAAYIYFNQNLLKGSRASNVSLSVINWMYVPVGLSAALLLAGQNHLAMNICMALELLLPFLLLMAAATTPAKAGSDMRRIPRNALLIYYTAMLVVLSLDHLYTIGIHLTEHSSLDQFVVAAMLSGLMMAGILQWRVLRTDRMKQRIVHRSRQLRQRLEHRRAQMEEQGQVISMLSHELKTPLSILRLAAAMSLQSAPLQQHMERSILSITTIIDRCTRALELEQTSGILMPAPLNVELELRELQAQKNAARIQISGSGIGTFATDRGLFRVVVGNLMDNALRYGDPEFPVHIHMQHGQLDDKQGIFLEFTNAPGNAGFPDPERLFEKFYRAPAARRESGAGLGLYIVQGLSKTLGGSIEYIPSEHLIRFKLWLPNLA